MLASVISLLALAKPISSATQVTRVCRTTDKNIWNIIYYIKGQKKHIKSDKKIKKIRQKYRTIYIDRHTDKK